MSGRLPYHGNQRNGNDINSTCGVDLRMMFLPAKLKQAGYATSMIGKSHLGSRSVEHLPINRGFDQVVVKHPTVPQALLHFSKGLQHIM
jgi:arylsulfatase A-like enzyme